MGKGNVFTDVCYSVHRGCGIEGLCGIQEVCGIEGECGIEGCVV